MSLNRPRLGSRRPAFTPPELIVVVLCVGLLVGIVQTSLESVAGKSRRAVCLDYWLPCS